MSLFSRRGGRIARGVFVAAAVLCAANRVDAELVVGLGTQAGSGSQGLVRFDSATPTLTTFSAFGGVIAAGEQILGIDFRPTTGVLYGIGRLGAVDRLLTINPLTGAASQVAALSAQLSGTRFGFDFNPQADVMGSNSLRVVSNDPAANNFRVNVANGVLTVDGGLNLDPGDTPINLVGSAYSNNDALIGTGTLLYGLDAATDRLRLSTPPAGPNAGNYTDVGALGVDTSNLAGLDISGLTGTAYATLTVGGLPTFNMIDLATGAATPVGLIGLPGEYSEINGLAVQPAAVPEPSSLLLLGLCGVGAAGYRLRRRKASGEQVV